MNRWLLAVFACLAFAGAGRAQVYFLEEFNGNALDPRWQQPPSGHWGYNVSGGQLNVTGLFYPGFGKGCCNQATAGTVFIGPPADFRVSVRMGWDAGTDQGLTFFLNTGQGGRLVEFGYEAWGGRGPDIYAFNGLDYLRAPPPGPGMFDFTIERHGSLYDFRLNGVSIGTLAGSTAALNTLGFIFVGPWRGPLGAFHVDRVEVVPAPGAMMAFALPAVLSANRRRRGNG
jgi:hypothetical protein